MISVAQENQEFRSFAGPIRVVDATFVIPDGHAVAASREPLVDDGEVQLRVGYVTLYLSPATAGEVVQAIQARLDEGGWSS